MPAIRIARSTFLAIVVLAVACKTATGQAIVSEDFTGASTTNQWIAINGACLTAGNSSSASNGGIPACSASSYYTSSMLPQVGLGTNGDAVGSGALRLTNGGSQGGNETGSIVSNWTFPSNQGLQVTFTTYTYGGNSYCASSGNCPGADGIGFYLVDGSRNPSIGAFGGSLGYSCAQGKDPADGMAGGYLGLGIDEYGNFSNPGDNTATGPGFSTNYIGLRGNGDVNWAWLNANYPNYYPSSLTTTYDANNNNTPFSLEAVQNTCRSGNLWDYSNPVQTQTCTGSGRHRTCTTSGGPQETSTATPDYAFINHWLLPNPISNESVTKRGLATEITYKLIIQPNGQLTLAYQYGSGAAFTDLIKQSDNVFITTINGTIPMPASFRFGFGASSGGGTNVHEITCFEASPAARTTGAPVVPISIGSSGAYVYALNTNPSPVQGLVQSYAVKSNGTIASAATWDAGSEMATSRVTPATSSTPLYSTGSDGTTVTPLLSMDGAAFGTISDPNKCLGSQTSVVSGTNLTQAQYNIVNYTVNPSYTWTSMPTTCATYLGSRAPGSFLAAFSIDDFGLMLNPPGDPSLISLSGYSTWAAGLSSRPGALLFTNNDGFLYSVDASTGKLNWGWMPRPFVSSLYKYSSFPYADNFGGQFAIVDGFDGSNWATYVLGSATQGNLWYDLKLSSSGTAAAKPAAIVPTTLPSALAGAEYPSYNYAIDGFSPSVQEAPVIKTIGSRQYAAFIVNTGSGTSAASYLVEFDITKGITDTSSTSSAFVAQIPTASIGGSGSMVTSNLVYDAASGALVFGTGSGKLYAMAFTGSASTDVGLIGPIGTAQDTANPVLWLGSQSMNGYPYFWAASAKSLTVFGIGAAGWQPLWATNGSTGYSFSSSGSGSWTISTTVTSLTSGADISAMPVVQNGVLIVPAYVPPSSGQAACNINGNGFEDLFSLASGKFPTNMISTSDGKVITSDVNLGQGQAFTPNSIGSAGGKLIFGGTSSSGTPSSGIQVNKTATAHIQWRVH